MCVFVCVCDFVYLCLCVHTCCFIVLHVEGNSCNQRTCECFTYYRHRAHRAKKGIWLTVFDFYHSFISANHRLASVFATFDLKKKLFSVNVCNEYHYPIWTQNVKIHVKSRNDMCFVNCWLFPEFVLLIIIESSKCPKHSSSWIMLVPDLVLMLWLFHSQCVNSRTNAVIKLQLQNCQWNMLNIFFFSFLLFQIEWWSTGQRDLLGTAC